MSNGGAPPCCTRCGEFDPVHTSCRLLAAPTLDNRRRLLAMPCSVQTLLTQRFRAYGEDVAQEAVVSWLSPAWNPDEIVRSFGGAPRDARLWLTSWPYFYLGRNAVRRLQQDRARHGDPAEGAEPRDTAPRDPGLALRVTGALERVHRVDPVSHGMLLDFLHDRFNPAQWRALLDCSEATVTDRKYLGIYRYAAYFHEVLERVQPHEAAVALATRRFAPGDPTDKEALLATRKAISAPDLTLGAWRAYYREGALRSLSLLGASEALGPETMAQVGTAFRRVLRVDA